MKVKRKKREKRGDEGEEEEEKRTQKNVTYLHTLRWARSHSWCQAARYFIQFSFIYLAFSFSFNIRISLHHILYIRLVRISNIFENENVGWPKIQHHNAVLDCKISPTPKRVNPKHRTTLTCTYSTSHFLLSFYVFIVVVCKYFSHFVVVQEWKRIIDSN